MADGIRIVMLQSGLVLYGLATILCVLALRHHRRGLLSTAKGLLLLAAALHAALLSAVALQDHRFPIANLYEAFLFLSTIVTLAAFLLDKLRSVPVIIIGAAPISTITSLFAAGLGASAANQAAVPLWIGIHIIITLLSFAAFALAFVCAVIFLLEQRRLKEQGPPSLIGLMPSLEGLYGMILSWMSFGLFLLTVGILVGYMGARHLMTGSGEAWRLDAKIIITSLTWSAYLVVMILSFIPACKGRRIAYGAVLSFSLVALTIWGGVFWSDFHRFV